MNIKKLFAVLVIGIMVFTLAACGGGATEEATDEAA